MTAAAVFAAERAELVRRPGPFGPGRRAALTALTDDWLAGLLAGSGAPATDLCLVAVGGHGRGELTAGSDLDLLLLHRSDARVASAVADRLWYPIWDSGVALDHAVRTPGEARRLASEDPKVLLGLLDLRVIGGDASLADQLLQGVRADWRAMGARRLPQVRELVDQRRARFGDLGALLEPDLKESYGGLREGSVLRAIAASWLTDVPHTGWQDSLGVLLDVRDALHVVSGRPSDVLLMQEQDAVADRLSVPDADALLRVAYSAARSIAYASDVAWHRVERLERRRPRGSLRRVRWAGADRVPLAQGIVLQNGEAVLALDADPARDPLLPLRAAAAAAQAGVRISPTALDRLSADGALLGEPWPAAARDAFVSLLGSGRSLVAVWEALDLAGLVTPLLPEWTVVRAAPQRNALHRFTVDRHLVETAVHASGLARTVDRPDLLLVGALLHDIGKAREGDHSIVGAELAGPIAERMGFPPADVATIVALVRHHLLLAEVATRRDLDDPATIEHVAVRVGDEETLGLLQALTEADSLATNPMLWSDWRRSLIDELCDRVRAALGGHAAPAEPELTPEQRAALAHEGLWVLVDEDTVPLLEITIVADDRVGLLATVAGVLSLNRLEVRSARVVTEGERAVQIWQVAPTFGSPPSADQVSEDIRRAITGTLDIEERLRARDESMRPIGRAAPAVAPPRVDVVHQESARATTLEVRAHDASGLLTRVCRAVSDADASIRGARVATLGSEAVDVFFLVDRHGAPLGDDHASAVQATVLAALQS